MASFASNLNAVELPINNAQVPKEGPKTIRTLLVFGGGVNSYTVDFGQNQALGQIAFIQGVYVDNSANAQAVSIFCQMTNQVITIQANTQQYVPVLAGTPPQFVVTSGGTANVPIYWLNVPLPADHWGGAITATIAGLNFDGSGNLKTVDQNLLGLTAAGGLNVNVISGGGGGGVNFGAGQTSATLTQTVFTPTAGKKFLLNSIDVSLAANATAVGGAYVTVQILDEATIMWISPPTFIPNAAPAAGNALTVFRLSGLNYLSSTINNRLRAACSASLGGGGFQVNAAVTSQ